MSDAKHTPGPWTIDPEYPSEVQTVDNETISSCWHSQCEGLDITLVGILPCSLEESAANARLIAAAPDLLEALREVVHWNVRRGGDNDEPLPIDQQFSEVQRAMAAIAKAEGRS